MGGSFRVDPIVYYQVHMIHKLLPAWNVTMEQFLEIDAQRDLLGLLRDGYGVFHLTGDAGVIEELTAFAFREPIL